MAEQVEVLVVGAGPTGLLTALGLARSGIKVRVVEAEDAIIASPRAIVYHWSVLEGLDTLGVLDDALRIGFPKQDYTYLDWKSGEQIVISVGALEGLVRFPHNLHIGQDKLAEIALSHLRELGATVEFGVRVIGLEQGDDHVVVTADRAGESVDYRASWVIGADGARSTVRHAIGAEFEGITWDERFVATNIRFPFDAHGYSRSTLQMDDRYGAIIAKIDETDLWRCTYCEDARLPEESVLDRMPAYFNAVLPGDKKYELVQYSPYRMHQRAATTFRSGRIVLAGDAAHATNPTGGLGLTSGLFDAYVLYPAMAAIVRGEADDRILDVYSEERRRTFLEIASPQAAENKRFVYHQSDPVRKAADLERLRKMAADRDLQIERFMGSKRLETPSLVGRE